jgi:hypothetical protein
MWKKYLQPWLFSRDALREYANLLLVLALFAAYWYVAGRRGILWLAPRYVLIILLLWPAIRAFAYFIGLPFTLLLNRLRACFEKEPNGVPCPACGYDIRATLHRCPECGTELQWGQLPR